MCGDLDESPTFSRYVLVFHLVTVPSLFFCSWPALGPHLICLTAASGESAGPAARAPGENMTSRARQALVLAARPHLRWATREPEHLCDRWVVGSQAQHQPTGDVSQQSDLRLVNGGVRIRCADAPLLPLPASCRGTLEALRRTQTSSQVRGSGSAHGSQVDLLTTDLARTCDSL